MSEDVMKPGIDIEPILLPEGFALPKLKDVVIWMANPTIDNALNAEFDGKLIGVVTDDKAHAFAMVKRFKDSEFARRVFVWYDIHGWGIEVLRRKILELDDE